VAPNRRRPNGGADLSRSVLCVGVLGTTELTEIQTDNNKCKL